MWVLWHASSAASCPMTRWNLQTTCYDGSYLHKRQSYEHHPDRMLSVTDRLFAAEQFSIFSVIFWTIFSPSVIFLTKLKIWTVSSLEAYSHSSQDWSCFRTNNRSFTKLHASPDSILQSQESITYMVTSHLCTYAL